LGGQPGLQLTRPEIQEALYLFEAAGLVPNASKLAVHVKRLVSLLELHKLNPNKAIVWTVLSGMQLGAIKREIVIFSADWCEPCQRWKRCEQAKFADAGYTFAYGNPDDVKRVPHFIVTDGDKTVEISGYMTLDRLNAELAK
jgi:hypothetical protein